MGWSVCTGVTFYHSIFRKSIIAFGSLFNNLLIKRESTDGDKLETIKVPVKYGPTAKYLAMIAAEPQPERTGIQMSLPHMSFEIKGIEYDASRKLVPTQFTKTRPTAGSDNENQPVQYSQYVPVPYNLNVELAVISKNQNDGLQIIEQILPSFHPSLNISIEVIEETHEERDIAVVLNSINYVDEYEGDFSQRRLLLWTLSFTVKTYLFGPVNVQKDIRTVKVDYRSDIKRRSAEIRYSAAVQSTEEPPIPPEEIDPETDPYEIVETLEDVHTSDSDFFGL